MKRYVMNIIFPDRLDRVRACAGFSLDPQGSEDLVLGLGESPGEEVNLQKMWC